MLFLSSFFFVIMPFLPEGSSLNLLSRMRPSIAFSIQNTCRYLRPFFPFFLRTKHLEFFERRNNLTRSARFLLQVSLDLVEQRLQALMNHRPRTEGFLSFHFVPQKYPLYPSMHSTRDSATRPRNKKRICPLLGTLDISELILIIVSRS